MANEAKFPIDLMVYQKYSAKFNEALITAFDSNRYQTINWLIDWMIKLEYVASIGSFNDGLFLAYQILRVSR